MAQESVFDFCVDDLCLSALFEEYQEDENPISDSEYAEKLQFLEVLLASRKVNTGACETDHQTVVEQTEISITEGGMSSQSICEICTDGKESDEMFRIESCNHSYCSECIGKYVATKIRDNIINFTCPGLNCNSILEFDSCKHVLAEEVLELWEQSRCGALIDESQRYYCPFQDCSAMLVKENEEIITTSECPICRRLFCAQCSVPWHEGIACEEYQRLNEDEKGKEDLMVRHLAKEQKWARCPKCKFYVERTQGCPHITCRCNFHFCYGCGSEWTPNHSGCQST